MGINIYPLIIICCILIWTSKSERKHFLTCSKRNVLPIYYICSLPESAPEGKYLIPYDDLTDAEFLNITVAAFDSNWFIEKPNELQKLLYLQTLHIKTSDWWQLNGKFHNSEFSNAVFVMPSLKILRVTYFNGNGLRDTDSWTLTDNLKHFSLANSAKLFFNLTTSNYLESLSLINCSLKNIPENKGLYYLRKLDLRNNSLENMTVLDVASFCNLEYLNIADAKIDSCGCRKMEKLFKDMKEHPFQKIFKVKYSCNRRSNGKKCPKIDWDEVTKKRKLCLKAVTSNLIRNVVFTILGVAVALSIIIGVAVFILQFPD